MWATSSTIVTMPFFEEETLVASPTHRAANTGSRRDRWDDDTEQHTVTDQ